MRVYIYTSEPNKVDAAEIRASLEALGYYVAEIQILEKQQ